MIFKLHTIKHCTGIKYLVLHRTQFYFTVKRTPSFSFFPPAPCPPPQVQATLDCSGNRVLVSWLSRFPGSYTASMVDQTGVLLTCSTMNSSCWVPSLKCSQVYDVSVTYNNSICPSKLSVPIRINSGKSRPVFGE